MFGLTIISKAEKALYAGMICDLRKEKQHLEQLVEHERLRAEGAINLLLMKTQQAAITPQDPMTLKALEDMNEKQGEMMDIFGDGKQRTEEELLRELQS